LRKPASQESFVTSLNNTAMMNSRILFFVALQLAMLTCVSLMACTIPPDSAQQKKVKPWSFKSTARMHSRGMFAYGGRIGSKNPAFDISFNYARKQWGFLAFKAADMTDRTSANNFTLAVFYKNFKLGKHLTITPHLGAFLVQPHHFAGRGSDLAIVNTTTLKLSNQFSMEHTAMLGNMLIAPAHRDWVNRMRFFGTLKHWDIIAMLWHNNHVFDEVDYLSGGLQLMYSRIRLSDSINLSVGLTELSVLNSSHENTVPKDHQVLCTIVLQWIR
jgi:hypothetical protein